MTADTSSSTADLGSYLAVANVEYVQATLVDDPPPATTRTNLLSPRQRVCHGSTRDVWTLRFTPRSPRMPVDDARTN